MLRLCGAELRRGAGRALQEPEQLRARLRAARRGAGRRASRTARSGPTSSTTSPTARATTRRPARRSGSRPAARSTASSARSAPAARWPASRMALKERNARSVHRPGRPAGRGALQLLHDRRAEGRGHLDHRGHRPGPHHRQPRGRADRRRLPDPGRARRCRRASTCCEHEGLCLGGSSGINVAGAIRLARQLGPGHTIVTILCDYGTRYQSKLFNPEFLRSKGLPVPDWVDEGRQVPRGRIADGEAAVPRRWLPARVLPRPGRRRRRAAAASMLDRTVFYADERRPAGRQRPR